MKTGRKWRYFFLTLLVVVAAAFLIQFYLAHQGPSYLGKNVRFWFEKASGGDADSMEAFQKMGKDAVPYLRGQLNPADSSLKRYYWEKWINMSPKIRRRFPRPPLPGSRQVMAATLLGLIGPPARDSVPDLISAYNHSVIRLYNLPKNTQLDWSIEITNPASIVMSNLANFRRAFPTTNTARSKRMSDFLDDGIRDTCCGALMDIGGDNRQIVPLLLADSQLYKGYTIHALSDRLSQPWMIGTNGLESSLASAAPTLINLLNGPDLIMRGRVAHILGAALPGRPDLALPLLKQALKDPDANVRQNALESLERAENGDLDSTVPTLGTLLGAGQHQNASIRVLVKFSKLGAATVVPALESRLNDSNPIIRAAAAEALGDIGPPARETLAKLTNMAGATHEPDPQARYQAAQALWKIDRKAWALTPFRIESLHSKDEGARWYAAAFFCDAGSQAAEAVPALIETLQNDPSNRVRGKAAIALGEIGPHAKAAIPALEQAASHDSFANVKAEAAEALKRIIPDEHK